MYNASSHFKIYDSESDSEHNIKTRHTYKANKYSHFTRDITNYRATVIPFEVGARGYLTTENEQSLRKICSFSEKGTKTKDFLESISKLASMGSYLIFTARKQPTWSSPGFMTQK